MTRERISDTAHAARFAHSRGPRKRVARADAASCMRSARGGRRRGRARRARRGPRRTAHARGRVAELDRAESASAFIPRDATGQTAAAAPRCNRSATRTATPGHAVPPRP